MIKKLLAVILAVCLLTGCGFAGNVNFNDIEYVRPDTAELRVAIDDVAQAIEYGDGLRHIMELLDECYSQYYNFNTMYALAEIKACQDLSDEYYAAELAWCEENYAPVSQMMEEMYFLCGQSDIAWELEENYFWEGFAEDYGPDKDSFYNDELMELLGEEAELMAQYRSILSKPTIELDGKELDYYSFIESCDEDEYYKAQYLYYEKYNEPLGEVYVSLVKLRREIAEAAGYEDYRQMQFEYFFERSYSPGQADSYAADVKEHIVPVYKELMAGEPWLQLEYEYLSEDSLHDALRLAAKKMGGHIDNAFEFMSRYNYYDIELRPSKAEMSFQTYLSSYQAPFLFLDPYGDTEDILTFAHEFGHYVDAWYNGEIYENIDATECFSQAMEYLMLCYADEQHRENLERMKLLDTLDLYVQQAAFYEFEKRVYETKADSLDVDYINGLYLQLSLEYGYYDEQNQYYVMSWVDVPHFYEMPFYVISYPVSNDIALQIYDAELNEAGAGLELFNEMLEKPHANLAEIIESTGLESPFCTGRAGHIAKMLQELNEAG